MADNQVNLKFRKKEFNTSTDSVNGVVVFDTNTKTILVGGERYSSTIKSAVYNSTTSILTITDVNGGVITLNFKDDTSSNEPSSLLSALRDDINKNKVSIATINGTGDGSIVKIVNDAVESLDSSVTTASENNGVVTIKTSITEEDGIISNDSASSITLNKVATTGSSGDVSVTYGGNKSNVQSTITDVDSRITSLENMQVQYILPSSNATCPSGYRHYYNSTSYFTGSLEASASTMNTVYVCQTTQNGAYIQIITAKTTNTYYWVELGVQDIDLTGFVKSVTMNGKKFTPTTSGDIDVQSVVNDVVGESSVTNGDGTYISVNAQSTKTEGVNTVTLESQLKIAGVSTATSSNNGVPTSLDVKNYVKENLTTIRTWTIDDIASI